MSLAGMAALFETQVKTYFRRTSQQPLDFPIRHPTPPLLPPVVSHNELRPLFLPRSTASVRSALLLFGSDSRPRCLRLLEGDVTAGSPVRIVEQLLQPSAERRR